MKTATIALGIVVIMTLVVHADVFNMGPGLTKLETVRVDNPGNAGELSGENHGGYGPDRLCGAVAYEYRIGKYEVTAGQYCEFLNAVAKADTHGLYDVAMDYDAYPSDWGCNIKRDGESGDFSYTVAADWANRPANYVSWGDAARFANWLHNGQPTGEQNFATTEDGAYYLNGAMTDTELQTVTRKVGWKWAITSEDEWYKAAYHKNDGITGNYWEYPTGSNAAPGNDISETTNPGNNANYFNDSWTVGSPYYRTNVGEFELSESPYGTFDQAGNIFEWDEAMYLNDRGARGGSFYYDSGAYDLYLRASYRNYFLYPPLGREFLGFRVVQVPEPCTVTLLALSGLLAKHRRRRLS